MKRVAAGIIAAALALCACGARSTPRAAATAAPLPSGAALITIHSSHPGRAIPSGFLGLSLEYNAITPYAGTDPHNLNPVFEQLIRNLTPGQAPNLRIGTSRALPVSSPVRWPAQPPAPPSGWPTRGHSWPSGPGSKS